MMPRSIKEHGGASSLPPPTRSALARPLAVAGLLLLVSGAATYVDPDVWHLMALAREGIARGRVPLEDSFAYTPTVHPMVQHEWGTGIVLYGLATHGGVWAFQVM